MFDVQKLATIAALALLAPAAPQAVRAESTPPLVAGEVTKVDQSAGKITIRHGPIAKFDMDSMTMVFRANDPVMLKQVKPGDEIKFDVDKINGQMTLTKIEKGK